MRVIRAFFVYLFGGWAETWDEALLHVEDDRMESEYADARTTHHRVPR